MEKYHFKEAEAQGIADFLLPMLEWDPQKRATAQQMLSHPWLNMPANYDTMMKEKEYKHMSLLKKLNGEDEDMEIAGAVLGDGMEEQCYGDAEDNEELSSEDDMDELTETGSSKYGPNSPLLNIDHGPNPQFIEAEE
eukprot:TRINITY_DN2941_c0_g1_i1.p2 TRINITY_DN2941_c0_g1~~TRINITY_DN2941_c0_g1_i1.p2  ORF type:complete len:137 (-),score=54.61 TRINITY_DN2941_c0_g1_i1:70-480(-)